MADKNFQMTQRNAANTGWDNLFPVTKVDNVMDASGNSHMADYIRQPGYGTTAGSANVYTLTLSPALTAYTAGVCVAVKIHAANTGSSTININGLGAKTIKDSKGNALISGKLRLNGVYTLRYDGMDFIQQGEGGEYGTAVAADVLASKTIGTDAGLVTGTMANNGPAAADTVNLTTEGAEYTIAAGFHSGLRKIKAVISGLVAGVIKAGVTVGGIVGTFTADATAIAAQMLAGVTAYVNGNKITGTMPNRANDQQAVQLWTDGIGHLSVGFPTGAYITDSGFGAGKASVQITDPNFIAANIRKNVPMFGVTGAYNYAADFDIPGYSEQLLWERTYCADSGLYTKLSDGHIVFIGRDGNSGTTYYQAVKINGDTGQTIWAIEIPGVNTIQSGIGMIQTDQYDNVYIHIRNTQKIARITNNGTVSWVITMALAGFEISSDGSTLLAIGGRNLYKINAATGTIAATIPLTWLPSSWNAGGWYDDLSAIKTMPDGTIMGYFWIDNYDTDDEYAWFRFDINGNKIASLGNYTPMSTTYQICGSYYIYYDWTRSGIFRTPNADFSGEVKIVTYSGSTAYLTMVLPNNRFLMRNGLSYEIRDINGNLLKSGNLNGIRPDSNWWIPEKRGRATYPTGDAIVSSIYGTLRKYKRGTYL